MVQQHHFSIYRLSLYAQGLINAPLAQSVERFHGKEKVTGSIPVGGSKVFYRSHIPGGIAQLGRASGS